MTDLFPDQQKLRDDIRAAMRRSKRILVQAETGFGKTVLGSNMITSSRDKGNTSMFIVPRRELLKQTAKSFARDNIQFSYVAAGHRTNPFAKTFLCTTPTLVKRLDSVPVPKVIFMDEAHFAGETNKRVVDYFVSKGAWAVALSATPRYPDGSGMGDCYDEMVCGPDLRWLIDNKRLSDYRLFAPSRPDLSGVKVVAGEYSRGELADKMEHDSMLIGDAVKHYSSHAMGRLAIAYCTSRKHSNIVAQKFRDAGIPAAHVDGDTPDDEMFRILLAFARREILVLCNADLLLFGFDLSAAVNMPVTVEAMIDLRPTMSLTLQRQKNGRALRYKDYPAILLDHAGNTMRHNLPCARIDWKLDDVKQTKSRGEELERTVPVKKCLGGHSEAPGQGTEMKPCHFTHTPAPRCPNCGAWYKTAGRMVKNIDGELVEVRQLTVEDMSPSEKKSMQENIDRLTDNAIAQGVPPHRAAQWAAKKVTEQMLGRKS